MLGLMLPAYSIVAEAALCRFPQKIAMRMITTTMTPTVIQIATIKKSLLDSSLGAVTRGPCYNLSFVPHPTPSKGSSSGQADREMHFL